MNNNTGYVIPAAGKCKLRLVSYVEIGKHASFYMGAQKLNDKVTISFELIGSKYPPVEVNGQLYPQKITITENLSYGERANLRKLLLAMRGNRHHINSISEMIGEAFLGEIIHETFKRNDGSQGVYARLKNKDSFLVFPPIIDGQLVDIPEPSCPIQFFLYNEPTLQQWESLSRKQQQTVQSAEGFLSSKVARLLNAQPKQQFDEPSDEDFWGPAGDNAKPVPPPAPTGRPGRPRSIL